MKLVKQIYFRSIPIIWNLMFCFIMRVFVSEDIELESITSSSESIEDYYFKIMREAQQNEKIA